MRVSRGGAGGPDPSPLKKNTKIGFLSHPGPDSLKTHKTTKPAFNVGLSLGRQQNAIQTIYVGRGVGHFVVNFVWCADSIFGPGCANTNVFPGLK